MILEVKCWIRKKLNLLVCWFFFKSLYCLKKSLNIVFNFLVDILFGNDESPFPPHSSQHRLVLCFVICASLSGVRWHLVFVSICISWVISYAKSNFAYTYELYVFFEEVSVLQFSLYFYGFVCSFMFYTCFVFLCFMFYIYISRILTLNSEQIFSSNLWRVFSLWCSYLNLVPEMLSL